MRIFIATIRRHPDLEHPKYREACDFVTKHGILTIPHTVQFAYVDGISLIPLARNLVVAECLAQIEDPNDAIFMADDDIWFRNVDIRSAIESQLPIVGFPCLLKSDRGDTRTLNYSVYPGEPWIDPDKDWRHIPTIGTGAMMVRAHVFHAMQKRRPHFDAKGYAQLRGLEKIRDNSYDYFPMGVREALGRWSYVGEDYGFCLEAMDAGYPVHLHGTAITGHMVYGSEEGYLCDYPHARELQRQGVLRALEMSHI